VNWAPRSHNFPGGRRLGANSRTARCHPPNGRYYEEEGLVAPIRTNKGTRYYSDFTVQRLEVCVRLAAAGFHQDPEAAGHDQAECCVGGGVRAIVWLRCSSKSGWTSASRSRV